jgi:hypothetical protein
MNEGEQNVEDRVKLSAIGAAVATSVPGLWHRRCGAGFHPIPHW